MSKFNYNDIVGVSLDAPAECRPCSIAWVVGVFNDEDRWGYFDQFPAGTVYTIEFEDWSSIEIHEQYLARVLEP